MKNTFKDELIKFFETRGIEIEEINKIPGGTNNRLLCVTDKQKKEYIVKIYKKEGERAESIRQKREIMFYEYLRKCENKNAPQLITYSKIKGWTILEKINGFRKDSIDYNDIDKIVNFVCMTNQNRHNREKRHLFHASEALTSREDIIKNLRARYNEIKDFEHKTKEGKMAIEWVVNVVGKEIQRQIDKEYYCRESIWSDIEKNRIASQSDVGLRNLLEAKGEIIFFDFEYSGLDDISKMCADWVVQPEYTLDERREKYLIEVMDKSMGRRCVHWKERYHEIKPLLTIKWCLILARNMMYKTRDISVDRLKVYLESDNIRRALS